MVEKRTITLIALAVLVWAFIATCSAAYYYLEQARYLEQTKENFEVFANKRNMLSSDYSALLNEYQFSTGVDYSTFMDEYEKLLSNLKGNYTSALDNFPELNRTYNNLLDEFQALSGKGTVTREEFGSLLDKFYKLFATLALKEMENLQGQLSTIKVNLCIDYGNTTVEWHNISTASGTTLFDITRKVAKVEYSYWPTMEPGHILVDSINDCKEGYWIWHYWDASQNTWVFGPFGCDAWVLKDNGIYNWTYFKY
ncbi:MAG: hypothetical protein QXF44_00650 [Candidatus Bathyarchaeia archaeon]